VPRKLKFEVVAKLLNPAGDGVFVRTPTTTSHAFDKDYGLSRDQWTPLIAALGVNKMYDPINQMWNDFQQDSFLAPSIP